ncbi:hypothetical protein JCM6882_000139 [Rhodosporidiobolus microsporus]
MDKSPSSHQFESLNQEDKAASTAAEGVEGAGEASPPTSLLDLPDELLTHIYDEVYRSQRPQERREDMVSGILVSLDSVRVNKRIFNLARPVWFQHLGFPRGLKLDNFLAELISHAEVHTIVHCIVTPLPYSFPALHSSVIRSLSNLTSLTLSFPRPLDGTQSTYTIPISLTAAFRALSRLEHLKIVSQPRLTFEDTSFSLNGDMPTLRRLDIDNVVSLSDPIFDGATLLRSLTLRDKGIAPRSIPWATVVSLQILPGASETIEDQSTRQQFEALLFVLQESKLERLDVGCETDICWESSDVSLPSVRVLSIEGYVQLQERNNLPNLWSFLSVFPSLSILHLRSISFSSDCLIVGTLAELDPVILLLTHPSLAALLAALRTTTVLTLRISDEDDPVDMRWTRCSREEDFVGQKWMLGGENNV